MSDRADDVFREGIEVRRDVLGAEHVDRARRRAEGVTQVFDDFITRYAWGEVWARPGLDRRTRSCLTLALLTALGRTDELELHAVAALRNGLDPAEVVEVVLHSAVYCGVPAARAALEVARRAWEGID